MKFHIRPINQDSLKEKSSVAKGMSLTLSEVLEGKENRPTYSLEWLINRVEEHLDPAQIIGQVFVAVTDKNTIIGHCILRVDKDEKEQEIGLFSTSYVDLLHRNNGVGNALLMRGEAWIRQQGLKTAITYTDKYNTKLQELYLKMGYQSTPMPNNFVKLWKCLSETRA